MNSVTCDITVSLDGFVAGPNQSRSAPLGEGGEDLHRWMFEEPEANATAIEGILSSRAYIMGRNMFAGPGPGTWAEDWHGWWGVDPPYHAPVFVLTHHPRPPLQMEGGTTFTFVSDGIRSALDQAREAAGGEDVAIAGGAETARQYLAAGLIDELRLHIAPVLLGSGERLFDGVGNLKLEQTEASGTRLVTHLRCRVIR
ncbi:5-amino-6-(5-phosphoribosylamino)uracil reductase [Arthrobacter sp. AFG7.2]|uniref:dihydrofolate reductase family protein n=1 Tax=Arthrobacter sp. AFG7.2 TaxID=1688693 RepID=UPI000C9DD983|nr:dihydrofolate reductase family protein [Arthrobacter sp. AFG7.2]PNI07165.1 5-amino-6-(5-phosphoribosylamino)uracil reductase [Arthrobacter sp. AFG7.2]